MVAIRRMPSGRSIHQTRRWKEAAIQRTAARRRSAIVPRRNSLAISPLAVRNRARWSRVRGGLPQFADTFTNRQDCNSVLYRGGPARARFACQSLGQPSLPVRRLAFWIQRQSESQPNAGTQHPTPGTRFGRRCPLAADDRQASQSGCCSACIGAGASCSVPGSRPSQTTMLSMSVTPRSRISSPSGPTVRRSESAISSWLAIR